ncbi:unnamed protein product [Camellia sinensis]
MCGRYKIMKESTLSPGQQESKAKFGNTLLQKTLINQAIDTKHKVDTIIIAMLMRSPRATPTIPSDLSVGASAAGPSAAGLGGDPGVSAVGASLGALAGPPGAGALLGGADLGECAGAFDGDVAVEFSMPVGITTVLICSTDTL